MGKKFKIAKKALIWVHLWFMFWERAACCVLLVLVNFHRFFFIGSPHPFSRSTWFMVARQKWTEPLIFRQLPLVLRLLFEYNFHVNITLKVYTTESCYIKRCYINCINFTFLKYLIKQYYVQLFIHTTTMHAWIKQGLTDFITKIV